MKTTNLFLALGVASLASICQAQTWESVFSVDISNFDPTVGAESELILTLENNNEVKYFSFDYTLTGLEIVSWTPVDPELTLTVKTEDTGNISRLTLNDTEISLGGGNELGVLKVKSTASSGWVLGLNEFDVTNLSGDNFYGEFGSLTINTLPEDGRATYCSLSNDMVVGATVKYATVGTTSVTLTASASNIVLATEGVIIEGNKNGVYGVLTFTDDVEYVAPTPLENDLIGLTAPKTVAAGDAYVLYCKTGGTESGFYKYAGGTISAGKAYLPASSLSPARLLFETETGIDKVNAEQNDAIFNLQGNMLQKAQKGINVVNGRKVMF